MVAKLPAKIRSANANENVNAIENANANANVIVNYGPLAAV